MDNEYGYRTTIDIPAEVAAHEPWFDQTLTRVNDASLRLGIFGYTVPAGVVHRTRAKETTVVSMIEAATVTPTGD